MALEQIKTDGSETGGSSAHKINVGLAHTDTLDIQVPLNTSAIATLESDVSDNTDDIGTNTTAIGTNTDGIAAQALLIQDNTDAINAVSAPTLLKFVPQVTPPTWQRGQLWYDAGTEAFSGHGDVDGVTLNIGQEQYIRVVNNSGVTIPNGAALTQAGVDVATQLPQAILAIADTFVHATTIGLATHDIVDGAIGICTTFGNVSDLDTGSFLTGDRLYLSSTVAGTLTTTAPDIASAVGRVIISDATSGRVFVAINNTIALPTIYGVLDGGVGPATLDAGVYTTLTNYADSTSLLLTVDPVNGIIGIPLGAGGGYRLTVNLAVGFDDTGNTTGTFTMRMRATDGSQNVDIPSGLPKNAETANFYPSIIFEAVEEKNYELQVMSADDLTSVTYPLVTIDITSVHIR